LTEIGGLIPALVSVDDPSDLRRRNKKMATPATTSTPAVAPTAPPTNPLSLVGAISRTVGNVKGAGPASVGTIAGDSATIVIGAGPRANGAKMGDDGKISIGAGVTATLALGLGVTNTTALGLGVSNMETVVVDERVGAGTVEGVEPVGKAVAGADGIVSVLRV
jgi:hypothetical protein